MSIDLAEMAVVLETRGLSQAQRDLAGLDKQGKQTGQAFDRMAEAGKRVGDSTLETTRRIMQQEAQAKANAQALERLQRQARETFERIALDVGRATADYKLGIISLGDYRTALSTAKQEAINLRANTGALSPQQLAAFDRVLVNIGKSTEQAARGTQGLRNQTAGLGAVFGQQATTVRGGVNRIISGVQQLGVVALGTRSAVGSLVTGGLISLGASAGVTLAVVAGIGAIAFAFEKLTAASRSAEEQTSKSIDRLVSSAETRIPKATQAYRDLNAALAEQKRLAGLRGDQAAFTPEGFWEWVMARLGKKTKADKRADTAVAEGRAAVVDATREEMSSLASSLAEGIKLGTATPGQIQSARGWLDLLREQIKLTKDLKERNRLQADYNALQDALDEHRSKEIDQIGALVDLHAADAKDFDRLRAIASETDLLLKQNPSRERKILLLKQQAEEQRILATLPNPDAPSRNVSFAAANAVPGAGDLSPWQGAVAGIPGALPSLLGGRGGATGAGLSPKSIAEKMKFDEVRETIAKGLSQSLIDGIAGGFERGFAEGNIGAGFKQLTGALLNGLGDAAIAFGVAGLGIAKLQAVIMAALSSLNPVAAIGASIALIALGGALKGAASGMFSGGHGGGGPGARSTDPQSYTHRVFVGGDGVARETTQPTAGAAGASAPFSPSRSIAINRDMNSLQPVQRVTHNWTLIGANDPLVQRGIADIVNAADSRGLVRIGGR